MSEANGNGDGIIVVGKKGLRKFRYDETTKPVEIDVLLVSNQWYDIEQQFYAPKKDGEFTSTLHIPPENYEKRFNAAVSFVREILEVSESETISFTSAMHFIKLLNDEADKLKDFFVPASAEARSSPENSAADVTFSA